MIGRLRSLFEQGNYNLCLEESESVLAFITEPSLRREVLKLLFHTCVELDLYDKAHSIARELISLSPLDEGETCVAVLSSLLNLDASLLRQVASYIQEPRLKDTLIQATKSILEYVFPMPYALGLCWWQSIQGQSDKCFQAVTAMREKDYGKAFDIAETVLDDTPNSFPMYWVACVCSVHLDRVDAFIRLAEYGIATYPSCWRLYLYAGMGLSFKGDFSGAHGFFQESLRRNPASGENWLKYGDTLCKQARYDEAIRAYRRALSIFRRLKTPVRYSGTIYTLKQGLLPAQARRTRLPRCLLTNWYRLLALKSTFMYATSLNDFVTVVEQIGGIRFEVSYG